MMPHSFAFMLEPQYAQTFHQLMSAFTFNNKIQDAAKVVLDQIGTFYGIHWRQGDSPRFPLFDCVAHGLKTSKPFEDVLFTASCKNSDDEPVSFPAAIKNLTPRGSTIFLASNEPSMRWYIKNRKVYTIYDFIDPDKYSNLQMMCIEQLILSKSRNFIGSFLSSFTEYVLLMRMHENPTDADLRKLRTFSTAYQYE